MTRNPNKLLCVQNAVLAMSSGVHTHLVVAGTEVQFGEEGCAAKLVQQLLHHGYGKLVFDHCYVKGFVVDAEAP
jgi:hypothetical protein